MTSWVSDHGSLRCSGFRIDHLLGHTDRLTDQACGLIICSKSVGASGAPCATLRALDGIFAGTVRRLREVAPKLQRRCASLRTLCGRLVDALWAPFGNGRLADTLRVSCGILVGAWGALGGRLSGVCGRILRALRALVDALWAHCEQLVDALLKFCGRLVAALRTRFGRLVSVLCTPCGSLVDAV